MCSYGSHGNPPRGDKARLRSRRPRAGQENSSKRGIPENLRVGSTRIRGKFRSGFGSWLGWRMEDSCPQGPEPAGDGQYRRQLPMLQLRANAQLAYSYPWFDVEQTVDIQHKEARSSWSY
jgi:hypothetical protein